MRDGKVAKGQTCIPFSASLHPFREVWMCVCLSPGRKGGWCVLMFTRPNVRPGERGQDAMVHRLSCELPCDLWVTLSVLFFFPQPHLMMFEDNGVAMRLLLKLVDMEMAVDSLMSLCWALKEYTFRIWWQLNHKMIRNTNTVKRSTWSNEA